MDNGYIVKQANIEYHDECYFFGEDYGTVLFETVFETEEQANQAVKEYVRDLPVNDCFVEALFHWEGGAFPEGMFDTEKFSALVTSHEAFKGAGGYIYIDGEYFTFSGNLTLGDLLQGLAQCLTNDDPKRMTQLVKNQFDIQRVKIVRES